MSVYERRDLSGNMFGRGFDSRRLHFRKVEKQKELKPYKIKVLALFLKQERLVTSSYTSYHIIFLKPLHFLFLLVILGIA